MLDRLRERVATEYAKLIQNVFFLQLLNEINYSLDMFTVLYNRLETYQQADFLHRVSDIWTSLQTKPQLLEARAADLVHLFNFAIEQAEENERED